MQGLGYLGRFRPSPHVIPDLWSGISRPRGGEDILGPPLAGSSLKSGGGLVVEDTMELRPGARRYELTDWLGSVRVGGGRPAPSHLQGQEAGGVSGGGGGGEGLL